MKTSRFLLVGATLLLGASFSLCRAEDWTMPDGRVYHDVKVVKAEPDAVTILHHNGGAFVPLATLPPALQKRFAYDPVRAQLASVTRALWYAESARAMKAERDACKLDVPFNPGKWAAGSSTGSSSDTVNTGIVLGLDPLGDSSPGHHSMSELVDVHQRLRDQDLGDNHHTTSELVSSVHSLSAEPDPKHHSMDELFH